ncbi:hypothetical protein CRG98_020552, partial [Punica granatum]
MDRPAPGLRLEAITPPRQDIMRIWRTLQPVDHAFIRGIIGDMVMFTETPVDWIFLRTAMEFWDSEHAVFNFQGTELAPTIEEYTALIQRPTSTTQGIFVPNPFATIRSQLSSLLGIPTQDIHEELHQGWDHGIRIAWLSDWTLLRALTPSTASYQHDTCHGFLLLIWLLAHIRPFCSSHPFSYIADERSLIERLVPVIPPLEHSFSEWRHFWRELTPSRFLWVARWNPDGPIITGCPGIVGVPLLSHLGSTLIFPGWVIRQLGGLQDIPAEADRLPFRIQWADSTSTAPARFLQIREIRRQRDASTIQRLYFPEHPTDEERAFSTTSAYLAWFYPQGSTPPQRSQATPTPRATSTPALEAESSTQATMRAKLQAIREERDRLRCELVDSRAENCSPYLEGQTVHPQAPHLHRGQGPTVDPAPGIPPTQAPENMDAPAPPTLRASMAHPFTSPFPPPPAPTAVPLPPAAFLTSDQVLFAPPPVSMPAPTAAYIVPPPMVFPASSAPASTDFQTTELPPYSSLQPHAGLSYPAPPPINTTFHEPGTPTHAAQFASPTHFFPEADAEQERRLKRIEETIQALQANDARPDARYVQDLRGYDGSTPPPPPLPGQDATVLGVRGVRHPLLPRQPVGIRSRLVHIIEGRGHSDAGGPLPEVYRPIPILRRSASHLPGAEHKRDGAGPKLFHSMLRGIYYSHLLAHTSSFSDLIEAGKKLDLGIKLGRMEGPASKGEESSKKVPATSPSPDERRGKEVSVNVVNTAHQASQQYSENPLPDHRPSSGPSVNMISTCASGRDEDTRDDPLPFVIHYTPEEPTVGFAGHVASSAPFVVDIPAREPYTDSKVPWTYEGSFGSVEQQFSVMGVTRSGRVYENPAIRDKGKAPATEGGIVLENSPFPSKKVTEEEAEAFMKIVKASEYKVVEQMAKSPAHISLLSLLLGSKPHREALLRILTSAQVPKGIPPGRIEETIGSIFSNTISFSDDELPSEESAQAEQRYEPSTAHAESITFQVLDIPNAFSLLLGRPWIYSAGAVPSSLDQRLKFIVEEKLITVKGEEDYAIYKETAMPFISVGDDENLPFHSFETISGINHPIEVEEYKHRRGLGFRPSCHEILEARKGNHLHRLAAHYGRLNRGTPVPPLLHFFPGPSHTIGGTLDGPSSDSDNTPAAPSAVYAVTEELPSGVHIRLAQENEELDNWTLVPRYSAVIADLLHSNPNPRHFDSNPFQEHVDKPQPVYFGEGLPEDSQVPEIEENLRRLEDHQITSVEPTEEINEYQEVFAWSYADIPGLDPSIVEHFLPLDTEKFPPKRQQLRRQRASLLLRIKEEVVKQINAGFLEVCNYSEWVASIVPVEKKDGRVRVCVDYRDLNKASPKDNFPLPHIDVLVDNTARHAQFSFMDGFFEYNQIRMAEKDKLKT